MNKCLKCGRKFNNRVIIKNVLRNLGKRKYCLICSPFGKHNTISLVKTKRGTGNTWVDKEILNKVVKDSICYADVFRKLGYSLARYTTLKKYLKIYRISTKHFVSLSDLHRLRVGGRKSIPLYKLLVRNSKTHRGGVKKRLLKEGLKENKCSLCGQLPLWRGKLMSLILDHINGIWNDNRLANLRLLCPNCNATTETFSGRNMKSQSAKIRKKHRDFDNGLLRCIVCKNPVKHLRAKFCSRSCWGIFRKSHYKYKPRLKGRKIKNRPNKDRLKKLLAKFSVVKIGQKYGVSDNAIRKWMRCYNLKAIHDVGYWARKRKVREPLKRALLAKLLKSYSIMNISKKYKVSYTVVWGWVKGYRLKSPSRSMCQILLRKRREGKIPKLV
jgi:transposase